MWSTAWLVGSAIAADPVAPLGTDRLDEVAELRFTLVVDGPDPREDRWTWAPPTGRVTLERPGADPVTFQLGHPADPDQRAADARFLSDTFWLAPQLHLRWAGADATLVDHGPDVFRGQASRRVELRYAPSSGGYTPGDAHDLYVDAAGRLVGWGYRPGGCPDPTVEASFEDYVRVGPLEIATRRLTADGHTVLVRDLGWTPTGVEISAGDDPDFLRITEATCELGPVAVPRRAPSGAGARAFTRELALADGTTPSFDQALSVRDRGGTRTEGWSEAELALEDGSWLASTGVLDCDFRSLGEAGLRSVLGRAGPRDRSAVLTVLLEWALTEAPLRPAFLFRRIRGAARSCAATGDCDALYGWVARVR